MAPQYKLTYFNNRALAEPARLTFAYAGVPFEDVRLSFEDWPTLKPSFTWSQIPSLEVDGKQLAQSNAILRYLGKTFNLIGDNDFETAKVDEIIEAVGDFKKSAFGALMEKDEAKKTELKATLVNETIPKYFAVLNKAAQTNGGFIVGKKLTVADILVASYLDIFNEALGGKILDAYPALKSHYETVFALNGIHQWVASRPKTQW